MSVKPLLKKIRNRAIREGRSLIRVAAGEADPDASFNRVLHHFFAPAESIVIFDVGAHVGESIQRYRKLFPNSIIHAFEPDEENFANLCRNHADTGRLTCNNFGAGSAEGTLKFYRNLKTNTSSFNEINPDSEWAQRKSRAHNVEIREFTAKVYDARIATLDSYIAEKNIPRVNLLKLDTQGFEDEALKGCRQSLHAGKIDVIETELIVGDAYRKSLTFSDIENLLLPCGYKFYAINRGGSLLEMPELCFDLLYVHKNFLEQKRLA